MKSTINLASRSYLDHRLINRWMVAAGAVLLLLLVLLVVKVSSGLGELSRLKGEIGVMQGTVSRAPGGVSPKEYQQLTAEIGLYNDIIVRKSYDWVALLGRLESVTPEGVSLVSITPDIKKNELKIEGRARTFDRVVRYLDRIEESRLFGRAQLVSHHEITSGTTQKGIQFVITCGNSFR